MRIQESAENYLETILILAEKSSRVRAVDISTALGFAKASISFAMKKLKSGGYIEIDSEGFITLTKKGKEIAERMYERHTLISDWLVSLGVDRETAAKDACKIEHIISEKSFLALKNHLNKLK